MNEYACNNQVTIAGTVEAAPVFSHEVYGEEFYVFYLLSPRLSDTTDRIRVLISQRLFCDELVLEPGSSVVITGQFRSYNNYSGEGNRLLLSVFAKTAGQICDIEEVENPNMIYLDGHICKPPLYRKTPFGREITDVLLAVNRFYNKSDYIPVIAWGRNARFLADKPVGTHIQIYGRIQSRDYQKQISEDEVVTKTAYEVSVSRVNEVEESAECGM